MKDRLVEGSTPYRLHGLKFCKLSYFCNTEICVFRNLLRSQFSPFQHPECCFFFCFIFQLSCACLNQPSAHYLTCSFLYVFIFFRELLQHITGRISCLQSFRTVLNAPSYMFPIFRTPSVFCFYHIIFSCRMQAAVL